MEKGKKGAAGFGYIQYICILVAFDFLNYVLYYCD